MKRLHDRMGNLARRRNIRRPHCRLDHIKIYRRLRKDILTILFWLPVLYVVKGVSALKSGRRHHNLNTECSTKIIWEEITEGSTIEEEQTQKEQRRRFFTFSSPEKSQRNVSGENADAKHLPHPLRTDKYTLNVRWKDNVAKRYFGRDVRLSQLMLEFANDGRVRILPNDSTNGKQPSSKHQFHSYVGEWELALTGLYSKIPVSLFNKEEESYSIPTKLEHWILTSDLHINPFGARPKLTRGVILKDEKQKLFGGMLQARRVLGTFTGQGSGEDMVDLSYRDRSQ